MTKDFRSVEQKSGSNSDGFPSNAKTLSSSHPSKPHPVFVTTSSDNSRPSSELQGFTQTDIRKSSSGVNSETSKPEIPTLQNVCLESLHSGNTVDSIAPSSVSSNSSSEGRLHQELGSDNLFAPMCTSLQSSGVTVANAGSGGVAGAIGGGPVLSLSAQYESYLNNNSSSGVGGLSETVSIGPGSVLLSSQITGSSVVSPDLDSLAAKRQRSK